MISEGRSHQRKHCKTGQRCCATGMTNRTVTVYATSQCLGIGRIGTIGMVLVFMMADMLRGRAGLVLAIASDRRPGKLERQKNEQEDGKPATHDGHCNRV